MECYRTTRGWTLTKPQCQGERANLYSYRTAQSTSVGGKGHEADGPYVRSRFWPRTRTRTAQRHASMASHCMRFGTEGGQEIGGLCGISGFVAAPGIWSRRCVAFETLAKSRGSRVGSVSASAGTAGDSATS